MVRILSVSLSTQFNTNELTLIGVHQAIAYLRKGAKCKYTQVGAAEALQKIFNALHEGAPAAQTLCTLPLNCSLNSSYSCRPFVSLLKATLAPDG